MEGHVPLKLPDALTKMCTRQQQRHQAATAALAGAPSRATAAPATRRPHLVAAASLLRKLSLASLELLGAAGGIGTAVSAEDGGSDFAGTGVEQKRCKHAQMRKGQVPGTVARAPPVAQAGAAQQLLPSLPELTSCPWRRRPRQQGGRSRLPPPRPGQRRAPHAPSPPRPPSTCPQSPAGDRRTDEALGRRISGTGGFCVSGPCRQTDSVTGDDKFSKE